MSSTESNEQPISAPTEGVLTFTLKNFATPIVFYSVFRFEGPKIAIGFALLAALIQVLAHLIRGWKFSPYFILVTVFTVAFGAPDLFVTVPRFFKLEAFAQNCAIGLVFVTSLFTRRPLVLILAGSLPPQMGNPYKGEKTSYLRGLTLIWGFYFLLKATLFLYLAFLVDLGQLYILRVVIGNISAVLLFGADILYRKKFRKA